MLLDVREVIGEALVRADTYFAPPTGQ